jgi:acylphosphatase
MKRIKIKVSGIVQGVGFRAFAKRHALYHSLTGYTKNHPDGSVTIEIQGKPEIIALYLSLMEKGPSHAEVRHIKVEDMEIIESESLFIVAS